MIRFLDITVDADKRRLYKDGEKIKTSTLNFDLLVYFLENPNQVISKGELMQNVWTGKIVSDSTISKQVNRLKDDLLSQLSDEELIQTIHGQGFMFVIEVMETLEIIDSTKSKAKLSHSSKQLSYLFILVLLLVSAISFALYQVNSIKDKNQYLTKKVERLAILYQIDDDPKATASHRAMAQALRSQMLVSDYLSIKLEKIPNDNIGFKQSTTTLIKELGYDHVLNMQVNAHEYGLNAHLLLRQGDDFVPMQIIEAFSSYELISKVSVWMLQQLQSDWSASNKISNMTQIEGAFDDYLAGYRYGLGGDFEKAIKRLQQAVVKDPQFAVAWVELAVLYRKNGQVDKALQVINRIDTSQVPDRLKVIIFMTRGSIYYRFGQLTDAVVAYGDALAAAKKIQAPDLIASSLINQSYMYSDLNKPKLAMQNLEEAMLYIDTQYQKSLMAYIYSSLSSINKDNLYNIDKALEYIELAHDGFKMAGDTDNQYVTLATWANTYMQNAQFNKAFTIAQQVLEFSENNNKTVTGLYALKVLIFIDLEYGRFDAARLKLDKYRHDLTTIDNADLRSEYFKFEYFYHKNIKHLIKAKEFLEKLRAQSELTENPNRQLDYVLLKIDYELMTATSNLSSQQLQNLGDEKSDPNLWFIKAQILAQDNQLEATEILFEKTMQEFQRLHRNDILIRVINAYLSFMLEHKITSNAVENWLEKLHELSAPAYPYLKNKAKYLVLNGNIVQAIATMQQLKTSANQWWSADDEVLLHNLIEKN